MRAPIVAVFAVACQGLLSMAWAQPEKRNTSGGEEPECRSDADCAVLPRRCPWCGPTQRSLKEVGTRKEALRIQDMMARARCKKVACPPGSSEANWVDTAARCALGHCVGIRKVVAELHGDTHTRLFHTSICPDYRCATCTVKFSTEAAAKAGFRPHDACRPGRLDVPPALACRSDADCTFAWPGPCGRCPQPQNCENTWRTATNRAAFERARQPKGPPPACSPCMSCPPEVRWLGTKTPCVFGQCEVR
jgi:hypothetical protein